MGDYRAGGEKEGGVLLLAPHMGGFSGHLFMRGPVS